MTEQGQSGAYADIRWPIVIHQRASVLEEHDCTTWRQGIRPYRIQARQADPCYVENGLLLHRPQAPETAVLIRAIETLRIEHVEAEWFRHLPSHFGHTSALDASIKAMVDASAYKRGAPKLTAADCYQSLALAIDAVQTGIKQADGHPNDDLLASTALLAHFEGATKKHGIPSRLHLHGMAAILAARSSTSRPTQLARDILAFHACESFIQACIQGIPSPYEGIDRSYFAIGDSNQMDTEHLKSLSNELFFRVPRLVSIARSLRCQTPTQSQLLLDAISLSKSLLQRADLQAEQRLLDMVEVHASDEPPATWALHQSLRFPSVEVYEALADYWQSRLALLRLNWHLNKLCGSQIAFIDEPGIQSGLCVGSTEDENEMVRLAKNILMCAEYAQTFVLNKHWGRFGQALISVWGILKDSQVDVERDGEGDQNDPLQGLVLEMANRALRLRASPELKTDDMDAAADLFVGGPLEGRIARMYDV